MTNDSLRAVNVTTWHRLQIVSGSSCARADSRMKTVSAGGSSSTFSSVSAAAGERRSASRIRKTFRPGSGGGPVGRLPDLLADRVDVDVAALRLHHELVRMLVAQGQPAVPARAAPAVRAQQRGGERARGERLAGSLRAREDVRVVRTLRRAPEERHRGLLAREPARAPRRSWPPRVRAGCRLDEARPSRSAIACSSASRTLVEDRRRLSGRVDHHEALRMLLGDLQVRVGDLREERLPLLLDPVGRLGASARARSRVRRAAGSRGRGTTPGSPTR